MSLMIFARFLAAYMVFSKTFNFPPLEIGMGVCALFPIFFYSFPCLHYRSPSTAHCAIQHIVISGGNCRTAWDAQLDALNLACEFFSRSLKMPIAGKPLDGMLRLNRNIFVCKGLPVTICSNHLPTPID